MTTPETVTAPGDRFNFAQYLLELNVSRSAKAAFIDDHAR